MQQAITIQNATINAFAAIEAGQVAVVTNAAATSLMRSHHRASKCSEPRKTGPGTLAGWRRDPRSRGSSSTSPYSSVEVGRVSVDPGRSYPMPSSQTMPAALWATWVLGKSLCG